mmetsp:Transcript_924/g.2652  ORF Transcript_924/g.2652 Transcript_924/m.2652 type:complete len:215 (-) Transcript_924:176-820(-)
MAPHRWKEACCPLLLVLALVLVLLSLALLLELCGVGVGAAEVDEEEAEDNDVAEVTDWNEDPVEGLDRDRRSCSTENGARGRNHRHDVRRQEAGAEAGLDAGRHARKAPLLLPGDEEVHHEHVQAGEDDLRGPEHPCVLVLPVEGGDAEVAAGLQQVLRAEAHALEHARGEVDPSLLGFLPVLVLPSALEVQCRLRVAAHRLLLSRLVTALLAV